MRDVSTLLIHLISTLLALVRRKYRLLFAPKRRGKPGPKGPSPELIAAICEMKRGNPSFGYQRIAQQLSLVLDVEIDKDVVRRVLAKHYRPDPGDRGLSWLTFLGHTKDSLCCRKLAQPRSRSAPTTIRYSSFIAGKPISECSKSE